MFRTSLVTLVVVTAFVVGCSSQPKGDLAGATRAYHAGQYAAAYGLARPLASAPNAKGYEAAYVAGLSARQTQREASAVRYLQHATRSGDDSLSGDAGAALGLIHSQQGNYAAAAEALRGAAPKLRGESRAQAYYYLAVAEQKLGQDAAARTSFRMALTATRDPGLRQSIEQQRAAIGWTVQTGAYRNADNARTAAAQLAERVRGAAPALVAATDARGGTITLVQIGRFTTHDSARRFAAQLGGSAVVVPVSR